MKPTELQRIRVIDTHTGGEPTRVVIAGGPDLGLGTMHARRAVFASQFDDWRQAIVCEPRGSDVMVGALLTPPERSDSLAGVVFFNNVGFLGMCGHGTMGVAVALAYQGRVTQGKYALDTPAGQVWFELLPDGRVQIENVPSYRVRESIVITLADGSQVVGDIAWGGNWFFLSEFDHKPIEQSSLTELMEHAVQIRNALRSQGVTGEEGAEIDHIELMGPALPGDSADSRNFVLCPGGVFDRSPCGTGTSAKLACLAAAGKLSPGQVWRQASVIGSVFEASYEWFEARVKVRLIGSAYVNAEAELIIDPQDPFCMGIAI